MMGERTVLQEALFYGFSLERRYCQVNSACNLTAKIGQIDSRG